MAEFKINRFRYRWRGNWNSSTTYNRDDVVLRTGTIYYCVTQHTSTSTFNDDVAANWEIMNESSEYRGTWTQSTLYEINDLVTAGGLIYKCVTSHTSDSQFINDSVNWTVYLISSKFRGDWTTTVRYYIGDIVVSNGTVYRCIQEHTSAGNPEQGNNDTIEDSTLEVWEIYYSNIEYKGDFTPGLRYSVDDLVKFGGSIWRCIQSYDTVDDSALNFNEDFWTLEIPGQKFQGIWNDNAGYGIGDVVRYGGNLYVATRSNQGLIPSVETLDWDLYSTGYDFQGDWSELNDYQVGQVVRRNGRIYVANADTQGYETSIQIFRLNVVEAESGAASQFSINAVSRPTLQFETGVTYTFDQTNLDNVYYPNTNISGTPLNHALLFSSNDDNGHLQTGSIYTRNVVYRLDNRVVTVDEYRRDFQYALSRTVSITVDRGTPDTLYYYSASAPNMGGLINVSQSENGVDPGLDNSWTLLVDGIFFRNGYRDNVYYSIGDLVNFDNSVYRCLISHQADITENYPSNGNGFDFWEIYLENDIDNTLERTGDLLTFGTKFDTSTLGTVPVHIGFTNQVLNVKSNNSLGYDTIGEITNFRYVDVNGVDDITYGRTPDRPYRTIRYATQQVEQLSGFTTVYVGTGRFLETLPIIVPARCVILGDELRSTTIEAAPAVPELVNDSLYTQAALSRLKDIIPDILTNTVVPPTTGNTQNQIRSLEVGSQGVISDITDLIDDVIQYIRFYIDSAGTDVIVTGSSFPITDNEIYKTLAILKANEEFIAHEISSYISFVFPNYEFIPERCRRDVKGYLEAFIYDIKYPGNYKSILASRWYRNAVLGSATEDMFYLRDSTGVRNCTLKGLAGTLNPPNVFDLFQRPTGGAYCSLDPGWGPADERCWIINRSPYIQGVTTIGSNCVGQKIDGALHNGGNKSMVSNDFTQVLSNGVGAWVLNNGRAELVSVFTYYCQVGYLATDGGVIRGTNGNCSYGSYGALSQGNDPTETPRTGNVYTRNQQAVVSSALSGEFANSIQIFEWANAGSDYQSATFSIVGAGVGASTEADEFRDGAVFQAKISEPGDSTRAGGGGYLNTGGNAQIGGSSSTIIIQSNDPNSITEYAGMRLIIVAGVGTGQYGYIDSYDTVTKIVTVRKESTGGLGWDHVIPGTPLENSFSTNTVYRIEPRPVFSASPYQAVSSTINLDLEWSAVTFGKTNGTYIANATLGTGETPSAASFIVTKNGFKYSLSLNSGGTGYEIDDEVTILGTSVGGVSPANDITIRIDSVNGSGSIVNFDYEGRAMTGRYVAVTSSNNRSSYSFDAITWTSGGNLPSSGNWLSITSGQNKFVAVRSGSNAAAYSTDATSWTASTLPASRQWTGVTYGNNRFVAVAKNLNSAAYSLDGENWTASTLPTIGDSTINEWVDITYGKGLFVAIANSNNISASSSDGINWEGHVMDVITDSSQRDWVSVTYGNNRFVAISSQGDISYSFDGTTWYPGTMPTQDGSTAMTWKKIKYGQGVFVAICDTGNAIIGNDPTTGETKFIASSEDGIVWTGRELADEEVWTNLAFGNNNSPRWAVIAANSFTTNYLKLGTTTKGRVSVSAGRISQIRLWEPGSSYESAPSLTLIDSNNTSDVFVINRLGNGALSNPSFINRGTSYRTSSTRVTISGDGYADVVPVGNNVTISNLDILPSPGTQLVFAGYLLDIYSVSTITPISTTQGNIIARFGITPSIPDFDSFFGGQEVTLRERYSQIRITGHDFLDVGTGNFDETNYPAVDPLEARPFNEVVEGDGGRVFYTSTDQDGNFRAGELFAVEQATGIVTISAQFFDLEGLTELQLGGVRLGGSGVVIREFSTDPTFTANSNNIVPTQRAIKAYLQNRLSQGGSELATNSFIAGQIRVGPLQISNTAGLSIVFNRPVDFVGTKATIDGSILAQSMFFRSFFVE
jgi:hypothetical protein